MDDAMSEQGAHADGPDSGPASLRPAARAYAAIFAAVAEGTDLAAVADAVVDALTSTLCLESARLYLLEGATGARALRLLADSSSHSVLALDMPSVPMDADTPAARVVSAGRSEFVEDTHGLRSGGLEHTEGVSRWKRSVGRQAHATIPLIVHGSVFGALGLDWSEPHDFGATERAQLEGLALAVALAVTSFHGEGPATRASAPASRRPGAEPVAPVDMGAGVSTAAFVVKESGTLAPACPVPWGGASIAHVSVAWRREPLGQNAAAFWDVFPYGDDGSVAVLLGAIESSAASAAAQAAVARAALRSALEQGAEVRDVLATLGKLVSKDAPGVCWTSATVALLQDRATVLESFHGGESLLATLRSDGRLVIEEPGSSPLGATPRTAIDSRADLLLAGDRIALCAGGLSMAGGSDGADHLRAMLAPVAGQDIGSTAGRLLELGHAEGRPAVAVVLDVLEGPGGPR